MNLKKSLLVAVPALAMAVGALAFSFTASKKGAIEADAADYSISNRGLTINNDKSVSATFTVSNSELNMKGWLLCLFSAQPGFNPSTRKLTNSDNLHPYSVANCSHYFFVSNTTKTGTVSVTWAANSNDQKTNWNLTGGTEAEGETLADFIDTQDWYFVIGPRHLYYGTHEGIGAGDDNIWENCDYYVGRKSTLTGDSVSGQIYLDLTESTYWNSDGAKFAIYFKKDETVAYSDFAVEVEGLNNIFIASYELDFTPTKMKALRLNKTATAPSTDFQWNDTTEYDFFEFGIIAPKGGYGDSWGGALAALHGLGRDVVLDHYKRNTSNESEHYNLNVNLNAGEEFTINYNGVSTYHDFTKHLSLTNAFSYNENTQKIHVNQTAEYSLYFNTTEGKRSLYITTPTLAAADEWAQDFLNGGCVSTKSRWDNLDESYSKLPGEAKALFVAVVHESDPEAKLEGYVAQAVQRYDYVLVLYGEDSYTDFMERVDAGKVTPKQSSISKTVINGDNTIMIVTIVSMISVAGLGAFLFYKKKRVQD